ncbi:V-set domain-containing T-cell activation inhibitor 1 isoform X1 [Tachysurus fulvidraco]|uniref:V-set domain-containing T-cell activation inhibitor 1 isoform X1 n=1 Tax=Tachysurus fulvidraco TaxID=1234273 RepID=UPI001FF03832|nr:V-set domain-containing T-cell activation inhibitor 1 isoform X1 [Tachysurus fulvidraco]
MLLSQFENCDRFMTAVLYIQYLMTSVWLPLDKSYFGVSSGSVVTNTPFPVGNLGQDVILDCKFQTKTTQVSSDVSITWKKDGLTGVVYQYQNKADHLTDQNPLFKNRANLFQDTITKGNASLLLRTVRMEDEGVYHCSVTASGVTGTVSIHLRVGAFSAPNITSSKGILEAYAPRWLPKPDVTWFDLNGKQINSSTQFNNISMGIVQVISNVQVQVTDMTYTCIIQNALVTAVSQATVRGNGVSTETDFIFNSSPSIITSHVIGTAFIFIRMLVW